MVERGERKVSLTPIYTTKTDDICVKWFYLMMGVHISCFFTFKVHEKTNVNSD